MAKAGMLVKQVASRISGPGTALQTTMSPLERLADLDLRLPVQPTRKRERPRHILADLFGLLAGCQRRRRTPPRNVALKDTCNPGRWSGRPFPAKLTAEGSPMPEAVATLDAKLRQAVMFHQARRLAEAESIYRQILVLRPDLAD